MNPNHYDEWEAARTQEARDCTQEYLDDFRNSTTGYVRISYISNYTKSTKEYVLAKVYHMLLSQGLVMNYTVTRRRDITGNKSYVKIEIIADPDLDE
jgi:hypothetical protein